MALISEDTHSPSGIPEMNRTCSAKSKILMLPCAGASRAGQLTRHAVQELVLEGKGEWVDGGRGANLPEMICRPADALPFIVVDGCEQQCGRKQLGALNCNLEFHLSLADLGIEKTESTDLWCDALQLVKDAIIAEGTRLSERPPIILGGCGCR
ncbi:hypothetical protein FCL47_13160 [Desulfopila sp. IMCC35006]|nr:hypothetical protein FCL47_13160 [Desulfopila sp. IMCC35006]